MLFADIDILDEDFTIKRHRWVGVRDGRIAYLADQAPAPEEAAAYGEVYPGAGRLLMPALVNAHAHAPMTLLRGYAENLPLHVWLNDRVWPFEAKMTAEDDYWATLLACAEMARYGTVSFSDMYFHINERAQAVIESGMKANLCESEMFFEEKPFHDYAIGGAYAQIVDQWHGAADGRIRVDYNIHAEYTSNPLTCAGLAEEAIAKGMRIHLHASETKSEHEECKERHGGLTPIAYFESIGVLDTPAIAAHCVWAEDEDLDILARRGAFAVANPASNMKLASGFAPYARMLERGVNLCLGTDGPASNNNHDMFQDLCLMALIAKGSTLDPAVVSPAEALRAATRTGALAQGREDCGLVKEGFRADLTVLDVTGPSWCPATDIASNVVYAGHGSDVVLTMCDGRVVYRDGSWPTIDLERVKAEVSARAERIADEVA